jgi:hypothetical protein
MKGSDRPLCFCKDQHDRSLICDKCGHKNDCINTEPTLKERIESKRIRRNKSRRRKH